MRTSLDHLPQNKQADLARIVRLIHEAVERARTEKAKDAAPGAPGILGSEAASSAQPGAGGVEMIVLYGSHARGDWVFDHYVEDGITYEYVSDYDILIITDDSDLPRQYKVWDDVRERFYFGRPREGPDSTGVSLIVHTAREVNRALEEGSYFFADIQREGIALHDTGRVQLADRREPTPQERKAKAQEEFARWVAKANDSFEIFELALEREKLLEAAFNLHQATERLYVASCMVFTDYRPKLHDLYKLRARVGEFDRRLLKGFAHHTDEQRRLFKLLADAYVHARYTKSYTITREELEYLAARVRKLQGLTEEVCREHIAGLA